MNVGSSNKKRKYDEISNTNKQADEIFVDGEGQEKKRASAQTVQEFGQENQQDCDKENFNHGNMPGISKKSTSHYQAQVVNLAGKRSRRVNCGHSRNQLDQHLMLMMAKEKMRRCLPLASI